MTTVVKSGALLFHLYVSWMCLATVVSLVQTIAHWRIIGLLDQPMTQQEIAGTAFVILFAVTGIAALYSGRYLDIRFGARLPSSREMTVFEGILNALSPAYKAKYRRNFPQIQWRVLDSDEFQAIAYGRDRIAVSRGLLELGRDGDNEALESLKGVIAHEAGHHHFRDTIFPFLMMISTWPIYLARILVRLYLIIPVVGPFIFAILTFLLIGLERVGWWVTSLVSKSDEYRADAFAASIAGSRGLIEFFDKVLPLDVNTGSGFVAHYMKSHPPTELRRAKLEESEE